MTQRDFNSRLKRFLKKNLQSKQIVAELEFEDKQDALSSTVSSMESLTQAINALVDAERIYSNVSSNAGKTMREVINNLQNNLSEIQKCYSYMTGKQSNALIETSNSQKEISKYDRVKSRSEGPGVRDYDENFDDPDYLDDLFQDDYNNLQEQREEENARLYLKRQQEESGDFDDDDFYDQNKEYSKIKSRLKKRLQANDNIEEKKKQFFPDILIKTLADELEDVNFDLVENDGQTVKINLYENERYDIQLIIDNANPKTNQELTYCLEIKDKESNTTEKGEAITFTELTTSNTKRSKFIENLSKIDLN